MNLNLGESHRRLDLQGLRALAVIAVILYHAQVPGLSGGFVGVDFFFVLSGFLITYLLLKEKASTGRISLKDFWARRARRLLPASLLVLVVTLLVGNQILSSSEKAALGKDGIFATFFAANWRFASESTSYFNFGEAKSPLLHYWSLGVEEQFYFVWPLILVGVFFAARKHGHQILAILALGLSATSLLFCLALTETNQSFAFFGTHARAWQLGAGAVLAIYLLKRSQVATKTGVVLSYTGLGLMVFSVLALKEEGSTLGAIYPSWLALFPTFAAVALVLGGTVTVPLLTRFLSSKPMVKVGDWSYSLYLWHWPALTLGGEVFGSGIASTTFLVALTFLLAYLTYRFIEDPIRRSPSIVRAPGRTILAGIVSVALVASPAWAISVKKPDITQVIHTGGVLIPEPRSSSPRYIGSTEQISPGPDITVGELKELNLPPVYRQTCMNEKVGSDPTRLPKISDCTFGSGKRTAFILGDSMVFGLAPGFIRAANSEGWRVVALGMEHCSIGDHIPYYNGQVYEECVEYQNRILQLVNEEKPELVVLASSYAANREVEWEDQVYKGDQAQSAASMGVTSLAKRLLRSSEVMLVSTLPPTPTHPLDCLIEKENTESCYFSSKEEPIDPMYEAFKSLQAGYFLDLTTLYCDKDKCAPVVNGRLSYHDTNHMPQGFSEDNVSELVETFFARLTS